jgi:hypothetical protein
MSSRARVICWARGRGRILLNHRGARPRSGKRSILPPRNCLRLSDPPFQRPFAHLNSSNPTYPPLSLYKSPPLPRTLNGGRPNIGILMCCVSLPSRCLPQSNISRLTHYPLYARLCSQPSQTALASHAFRPIFTSLRCGSLSLCSFVLSSCNCLRLVVGREPFALHGYTLIWCQALRLFHFPNGGELICFYFIL